MYSLYTTEDVLNLMNVDDEPMCENSDDDLGMDIHDSDDETRYITQAHTHTKIYTCKYYSVHEARRNYLCILMLLIAKYTIM